MATANPLPTEFSDEIPASRLMQERDGAQRELAWLRRQFDAVCHERDELRTGCAQAQAAYRDLTKEVNRLKQERNALEVRAQRMEDASRDAFERGQKSVGFHKGALLAEMGHAKAEAIAYRERLCEILAGDAGEDCTECGGTGEVRDEIPDEFGTQIHRGGCTECFDGRVAREGLR